MNTLRYVLSCLLTSMLIFSGGGQAIEAAQEAPMLKTMVAAGQLPPLEERLPKDQVVTLAWNDGIGKYGGVIRVGSPSASTYLDGWWVTSYEGLIRLAPNLSDITPNVAKTWDLSDDATSLTFSLVEGIKWSDGALFDADDILFWWNDVIMNAELTPEVPGVWKSGDEPMTVTKVDDYTVRFDFAAPYPGILRILAHENGAFPCIYPAHYLQQFHAKYVEAEELSNKVKEGGYESWSQMFLAVTANSMKRPRTAGYPTIQPFMLVKTTPEAHTFERNPYYWKVDAEGNQLPYADGVEIKVVASRDVYTAKVVAGEYDFAAHRTDLANYPLYADNAEKAGYRLELWPTLQTYYVMPNLTAEYEPLRELFNRVEFRQALSLALNREEINEVLAFGLAQPEQITVSPESRNYQPGLEKMFAEFDADTANTILDDLGLDKRDSDGFRLYPDGKKVSWTLMISQVGAYASMAELLVDMWREVGLDVQIESVSGELGSARIQANQAEMNIWRASGLSDQMFLSWTNWYLPTASVGWAKCSGQPWVQWMSSGGSSGMQPPDLMLDLHDTYGALKASLDPEEQVQLGQKLVKAAADNLWAIGFMAFPPRPVIISARLKNVIPEDKAKVGYDTGVYYAFHSEVMYLDE